LTSNIKKDYHRKLVDNTVYFNANGEPLPWEADQAAPTGKCHYPGCENPATFNKYFCSALHQDTYYSKPIIEAMNKSTFNAEAIKAKIARWKAAAHERQQPLQSHMQFAGEQAPV
jgi:hypothetical protein